MLQIQISPTRTGTLSITSGSPNATGTNTNFATSDVNKQITIRTTAGDKNFVIAAVTDETHIALNAIAGITQAGCFYTYDLFDLDTYPDFPYSFNYNIADIREPDKRNADFSKTITIPGTKENNKILGHIFEIDIDSSFNPNLRADCIVLQDGIQLFKGNLQLLQINRNHDKLEYEVAVFGTVGDLFKALSTNLLTDLDLSQYNHTPTTALQQASWSAPNGLGNGYVYPLINNGLEDVSNIATPIVPFQNIYPATYVKTIVDAIFKSVGFSYQSDFFNTDLFKRLIIPSQKIPYRTAQINWGYNFYSGSFITTFFPNRSFQYQIYRHNNITGLEDQLYSEVIDFAPNQHTTSSGTLYISDLLPGDTVYVLITYITVGSGVTNTDVMMNSVTDRTGNYIEMVYVSTQLQSNFSFKATMLSQAGFTPGADNVVIFDNDSTSPDYNPSGSYNISTGIHSVTASNYSGYLNDGIKQADFLMDIVKMFNLYLTQDKYSPSLLHIEPRDDFYAIPGNDFTNKITDWNEKLDLSQEIEIQPIAELDALYYYFHYKSDSDYYNTDYSNSFQNVLREQSVYGEKVISVKNDFLTDTKEIALGFSPTPSAGATINPTTNQPFNPLILPTIIKDNSTAIPNDFTGNIRILYWGGMKTGGWQHTDPAHPKPASQTTYPYAGHLDDPQNPAIDLLFDIPKQVYWTLTNPQLYQNIVSGSPFNNLFNRYYSNFISELVDKDAKIVTMYIRLRASDFYNLDFRNSFFINGSYYHINKIYDYNPESEDSVKVEFVKINSAVDNTFSSPTVPAQLPKQTNVYNRTVLTASGLTGDITPNSNRNGFLVVGITGIPISKAEPADGASLHYNAPLNRLEWSATNPSGAFIQSAFSKGFS